MSNILTAKQSPRYENNKFYWYEGNTFAIELQINLLGQENNEPIVVDETDELIITFYKNDIPVHKFKYTNFTNGSTITMLFNKEVSKKFTPGIYEYTITYCGASITTIVANNYAEVE